LATTNLTQKAQQQISTLLAAVLLITASALATAQVAPLAPRWLAGTPPPPVETFAAGLERHHIPLTESALIEALRDPDGEVRSLAAAQLAAMDNHPALKNIVRAVEDERDPQVQVNLAGASTWLGSRTGLEQLERMCADINVPSTVRLDAARYVSNKSVAACFPAVQDIARNEQDPSIRVLAIQAAVSYRGQTDRAQTVAITALADIDPSVRIAAADALHSLRATDTIGALTRALQTEGDDTAREHIREAIRVLQLAKTPK
jgi:HEAT repeat protein